MVIPVCLWQWERCPAFGTCIPHKSVGTLPMASCAPAMSSAVPAANPDGTVTHGRRAEGVVEQLQSLVLRVVLSDSGEAQALLLLTLA
eukprot:5591855-Amphidinium_carterae.1